MDKAVASPLGTVGPEPLIARYRHWYDHERFANEKMIAAIESVPEAARTDARFIKATELAGHLAACRENHLRILQGRDFSSPWWPKEVAVNTLRPRYALLESEWSAFLDSLTDPALTQDVTLREGGFRYLWNLEGQIFQLVGHAYYHRGQISLLVDQLGGTTVDTDYVDWVLENDPRFGEIKD